MFQNRSNRGRLEKGGWGCFHCAVASIDVSNPPASIRARGNGRDARYGWPDDPELKSRRHAWYHAPDRAEQQALSGRTQARVLDHAPYLPLAQILQPTVTRRTIAGVLPGFAKFWNIPRCGQAHRHANRLFPPPASPDPAGVGLRPGPGSRGIES